ncbi:hypothetical protein PVT67_16880 [Gallaecimonas kandeliae]|uniref:hypothetical protein n=1 Tax=Gallaecimonas kandeliae TaxID=3029055 RepID=UPI00264A3B08|nr:hypothetical protein [Gallaecimonas kandeliae]WKE65317.1 hypothetical protein PVT67_16880 [Gallaecimonas kandeliae]
MERSILSLTMASVVISGCASNNQNMDYNEPLSSYVVESAKNQTNLIGKMRIDGRVHKQSFDDPKISLTDFWFVTSNLGDSSYDSFQRDIGDYCQSHNGKYLKYDTKGKIKVFADELYAFGQKAFLVYSDKDERTFLYECKDNDSGVISFSLAINSGDSDNTLAGNTVSKVRVALFENIDSVDSLSFRKQYLYMTDQLHDKWIKTY